MGALLALSIVAATPQVDPPRPYLHVENALLEEAGGIAVEMMQWRTAVECYAELERRPDAPMLLNPRYWANYAAAADKLNLSETAYRAIVKAVQILETPIPEGTADPFSAKLRMGIYELDGDIHYSLTNLRWAKEAYEKALTILNAIPEEPEHLDHAANPPPAGSTPAPEHSRGQLHDEPYTESIPNRTNRRLQLEGKIDFVTDEIRELHRTYQIHGLTHLDYQRNRERLEAMRRLRY